MKIKYRNTITFQELDAVLQFNSSGILIWKFKSEDCRENKIFNTRYGGKVAGFRSGLYNSIGINGTSYLLHRIVWFFATGNWPKEHIDHIDMNKQNNLFSNLREATFVENKLNRGPTSRNKTGIKGVSWSKLRRKYVAQIRRDGKGHFLGYYDSIAEAGEAYRKEAIRLHGDFARTS